MTQVDTKDIVTIKNLIAFFIPYFIGVGGCYLFGYWSIVDINVMEFIGLSDVAKLALYPLVASLLLYAPGVMLSEISFGHLVPVGGGQNTKIGVVALRFSRLLLALLVLFIFVVYFVIPEPFKWFVIAVLAISFSAPASHFSLAIKLVPNARARVVILQALIVLPILSFAIGRLNIHNVIKEKSAKTVDVTRSKLPLTSDKNNPVIYLGMLGSTVILREMQTGQIVLLKQREETPIFLIPPRLN